MRKVGKLLLLLCLCTLLLSALVTPAYAGDLDYIDEYHVTVTPNSEDGSLYIEARFRWTVLEEGPVEWLKIGIPNGSIREEIALSDNIESLSFDNSYMYVYFNERYYDGKTFEFAYSWVQEYMYSLADDTAVEYDYTPGWFDESEIGLMTLTWNGMAGTEGEFSPSYSGGEGALVTEPLADGGFRMTAENLSHGATMTINAQYPSWPTELSPEASSDYGDWDEDEVSSSFSLEDEIIATILIVIVVPVVVAFLLRIFQLIYYILYLLLAPVRWIRRRYAGGFGDTRYVFDDGLWYPMGHDGKPRPGSVGTRHKPSSSRSGGFSGGSRGGNFSGGGFSGGKRGGGYTGKGLLGGSRNGLFDKGGALGWMNDGRSSGGDSSYSSSCACACACASGGRAGCSAKHLYGAVKLDKNVSALLKSNRRTGI